jgi:hypothetical protein
MGGFCSKSCEAWGNRRKSRAGTAAEDLLSKESKVPDQAVPFATNHRCQKPSPIARRSGQPKPILWIRSARGLRARTHSFEKVVAMRKLFWSILMLGLVTGCSEAPPPVGPAAEAMTDDIEITMDELGTTATATTAKAGSKDSTLE